MKQAILFVCLPVIVITVASNPVMQVLPAPQCSICQKNSYDNLVPLTTDFQATAIQSDSYCQPNIVQNQTPSHPGFDSAIDQLLLSNIFGNPCLQKIIDPNTKVYNQNGQEIQRHANTDSTPSVINNYFIVPQEFFSLNDTKIKSYNASNRKRRVNSGRKANQTKTKIESTEINNDSTSKAIVEERSHSQTNSTRTRKRRKKRIRDKTPTKIMEQNKGNSNADQNYLRPEVNKTKKRRKQGTKNLVRGAKITTPPSENFEDERQNEKEILPVVNERKRQKRPRKLRTQSTLTKEEISESAIDTEDMKVTQEDDLIKNKTGKNAARTENSSLVVTKNKKTEDNIKLITSSESMPQLKNIESPIDSQDTAKHLTENRQTRNSKNSKSKKGEKLRHSVAPIHDDVLKNYFAYMYPGNYFYPNAFNLEQFYQPHLGKNSRRNKKRKNKTNDNKNNRKYSPNVAEVTMKPKKQETTTIINHSTEKNTDEVPIESTSIEITTESSELFTDIPIDIPHKVSPEQESDGDFSEESLTGLEPVISKPESTATKAKLEMPPTMIEDIHEYYTPELGREDIVPTIHNNGIVSDYYPIFYDDSFYANDDSYHIKDIENGRHFYTTDRGNEELLNRDRRKYDRNDEFRSLNLDINDRINLKRGFVYRQKDRLEDINEQAENSIPRPYTHAKIIKQENIPVISEYNKEVQFQTPPPLEKPDFRTKIIEKYSSKTNTDDLLEPVYLAEEIPDIFNTYFDTKTPKFSRLLSIESEIRKETVLATTARPKNDRIETVFAKTRVVKYGVAKEESEENVSVSTPMYEDDGEIKYKNDGHTTYVIAKSLGQVDDYYYK